jgi:16S rRNA A1518/A1519 N6-dimethyltransferase RsmA/KsgA/DIM1 with predicted DNA glycosylase/AP lyase activity
MSKKDVSQLEFGDFQTPEILTEQIIKIITNRFKNIKCVIEPTCGIGNFLKSLALQCPSISLLYGWEINPKYVELARQNLCFSPQKINISQQNFFDINWDNLDCKIDFPLLFFGNPPWITNTKISRLQSKNTPNKTNFQKLSGCEAILGKSNFDISEWILIQLLNYINKKPAAMAFLIKTSVARKLFSYICQHQLQVTNISIYSISAKKYFDVNVSACLFYVEGSSQKVNHYQCQIYDNLNQEYSSKNIGYQDGKLISDLNIYAQLKEFDFGCEFTWRSGIKHDCAKIMELKLIDNYLVNGLGEKVNISDDYLYPMYKGSELSKPNISQPNKLMIVTQKYVGEDTMKIKQTSPSTWNYLLSHADFFAQRRSSIYKKGVNFAIFGVGDYTFSPWKIAIAGLYKELNFSLLSKVDNKPIVLDDTCYFLSFESELQGKFIYELLTSNIALDFLNSLIFKDNKRPITVSLLKRISLKNIAKRLNRLTEYEQIFKTPLPLFS